MHDRRMTLMYFVICTLFGLVLYVPFRSNQWDLNGIIEVQSVQAGGEALFSPNHMLNRPIGLVILKILGRWMYINNPAEIFQYVTAFYAAVGLGFAFLASYYLTYNKLIAMIATVLLATAWSNWTFSTDVNYICAGSTTMLIALVLLLYPKLSFRSTLVGFFYAISILFWQANIFSLPFFIVTLVWFHRAEDLKNRIRMVVAFLGVLIFMVGFTYILVGVAVCGHTTLIDLITWSMGHGSDVNGRPPMWGKWDLTRVWNAAVSAVGSFVPIWEGLGIRSLLRGEIVRDKILGQISLGAFLIMGSWSLMQFIRQIFDKTHQTDRTLCFIFAYLSYLPFIIWWDPYEPKWFVIPNIFLILGLSTIWNNTRHVNRNPVFVAAVVTLVAVANFTSTIYTRHLQPNPHLQTAKCFVESTSKLDLFIPTDWDWFDYAIYFYDYEGELLRLIRSESERWRNLELIEKNILRTQLRGGSVYVIENDYYSSEKQQWLKTELGFDLEIFEQFKQEPAFVCNGIQFMRVVQRNQQN